MNQLKVNQQQTIIGLHQQGWSKRRIARELGLDRVTVRKYIAAAQVLSPAPHTDCTDLDRSKSPTNPRTGSEPGAEPKSPTPRDNPQTGSAATPGPASSCEPWREQIEAGVQAGLSVQRIFQDLRVGHQFPGSYHWVRRFVRRRQATGELAFRRMECATGQELQVDFGPGAWIIENGRRRKTHLFRCVLSHSRKGYSEAVWRQTSESFIRCLENAFRHFGGVTATVVIDNLKAGVIHADWFDPELNPKLEEFARYLWHGHSADQARHAAPQGVGFILHLIDVFGSWWFPNVRFADAIGFARSRLEWASHKAGRLCYRTEWL
jgi:transposase